MCICINKYMYMYILFGSPWKHVDYDDLFDVKGHRPTSEKLLQRVDSDL